MNHKLYKIKTKYNKRFPPKTETVKSFCQDSKRQTVNPNIDKGEREKETEGGTEGCKSSCYTQCRGGGGGGVLMTWVYTVNLTVHPHVLAVYISI